MAHRNERMEKFTTNILNSPTSEVVSVSKQGKKKYKAITKSSDAISTNVQKGSKDRDVDYYSDQYMQKGRKGKSISNIRHKTTTKHLEKKMDRWINRADRGNPKYSVDKSQF